MRIHTSVSGLVALSIALAGCFMGMSSDKFTPANSPAGAELRFRTPSGTLAGELLEVRDSGVVVAPPGDMMFVSYTAIRSAVVAQTPIRFGGRTPPQAVRDRLRLLSRYPAGIPADVLEQLLAARGQQSLRVYQP